MRRKKKVESKRTVVLEDARTAHDDVMVFPYYTYTHTHTHGNTNTLSLPSSLSSAHEGRL